MQIYQEMSYSNYFILDEDLARASKCFWHRLLTSKPTTMLKPTVIQ